MGRTIQTGKPWRQELTLDNDRPQTDVVLGRPLVPESLVVSINGCRTPKSMYSYQVEAGRLTMLYVLLRGDTVTVSGTPSSG